MEKYEVTRHTITISVRDGNFSYSHANLRVKRGDRVSWQIDEGDFFAVRFGNSTPLRLVEFRGSDNNPTRTDFAEVREDAAPGVYKYMAAVAVGGKIWIDGCPELIVEY